jgi:flagellar capping protein FliD
MHILRWLMKHPLMLAWLLAIVAILLNFGLGGTANNGKLDQVASTEAATVATPTATAEVTASAPAAVAAPATEVAPATTADAAAPQAQAAANAGEAANAASEADLLRAAREAFWSDELGNSVGFYTSLLKQVPDSLEYKGELANVYWKQGNAQQAAALFAEIAPQLATQGRMTEVHNMKAYVESVNPELAKKIADVPGK